MPDKKQQRKSKRAQRRAKRRATPMNERPGFKVTKTILGILRLFPGIGGFAKAGEDLTEAVGDHDANRRAKKETE